ncbi:MAG: chromate transporter [Chthoniobacterales bacterium]
MLSILKILGVFSLLSIMAIGGGTSVLPEMKTLTIDQQHWLTEAQFRDIYSIGQIAPGPNMLMVIVIGYHVAGAGGALAAFLAFFIPCCIIALIVSRLWLRFEKSAWCLPVQQGMAPIVVGLMLAGMIAIARTAITNQTTLAFAAVVFIVLYFGKKINPALLILAGGLLGFIFVTYLPQIPF